MMMKVELLNTMGTDDTVANAARVSYSETANNYSLDQNNRLIRYLAKHGHWSPFGHIQAQFRIKAPIFVARQLAKHQVGLCWNEVSYRYVEASQGYWEPKRYRKDSKDIKQGSGKNYLLGMKGLMANSVYESAVKASGIAYNTLLNLGVSKEQARAVLPTATNTEWYWTGSVLAFSRICNLRLDKATQEETREIAQQISDQIKVYFPEAWEALTGEADD
jgi:thymidylate synthase (FAD)